ncbi:MBL fold metallo-hydrolase [Sneathiella marina]|uniref:MBL fold metallo-hydrolase n=1 Tax=Sneathiella marina TaxID=2950108 RepID=A0ABY4W5G9_9PROT|nr:alkyl sulfatase dimerization domain-containing protein [Sneathiella marina]USG62069.1 MBL fold metallo-hydrolase [Sneathiella marina]
MKQLSLVGVFLGGVFLSACDEPAELSKPQTQSANERLVAHSNEFRPEVIKVADNMHVAVGYGLANSILIEGDDGIVIVDTMESVETAKKVKAEFDKITDKPVKGIIYTHNHADHILGSAIFAADDNPDVYSYETTPEHIDHILQVLRPIIYKRAMRQFGSLLPEGDVINAGIGPYLESGPASKVDLIRPTKTFSGDMTEIEVAGIKMELHFAPGETPDQLFVWLPDQKILLPGDNFYRSFPNLYAIRGTAYRDVMDWVKSLDKMRALKPEILVPSHTRPIHGEAEIFQTLTDYRDAIQFVHDQTIRAMNNGLTVDEIVEKVKLPQHLAEKPYLQEFYGRVDWSVRSIFNGYLGWFGGNATHLQKLPKHQQAEYMAELAGGTEKLREQAIAAAAAGRTQWALQLADNLLVIDAQDDIASDVRRQALLNLAEKEISANGRNYYLTQAAEQDGFRIIQPDPFNITAKMLADFPIAQFMQAMRVSLDSDKAAEVDTIIGFEFTDTGETFGIHVRKGIAEVTDGFPENPEASLKTESLVWKEILAKRRNPAVAFASGDVDINGSIIDMLGFLSLFTPPET